MNDAPQPQSDKRHPVLALIILLLVVIVGFFAWNIFNKPQTPSKPNARQPVVIYAKQIGSETKNSRSWPRYELWRKTGDSAPELLVNTIGNQEGEFLRPETSRLLLNKKGVVMNLENKIVLLDLQAKTLRELYKAKYQISDFMLTTDGKRVFIWDEPFVTPNREYLLSEYNLETNVSKILAQGTTSEMGNFFFGPLRADVLLLWLGAGEVAAPFYLTLPSAELKRAQAGQPGEFRGFSNTGDYMKIVSSGVNDICNDFSGDAPSVFDLRDPLTGNIKDSFGDSGKATEFIDFSPDDKELLYATYAPPADKANCEQKLAKSYYRLKLATSDAKPELIEDYHAVLFGWYPDRLTSGMATENNLLELGYEFIAGYYQ